MSNSIIDFKFVGKRTHHEFVMIAVLAKNRKISLGKDLNEIADLFSSLNIAENKYKIVSKEYAFHGYTIVFYGREDYVYAKLALS